MQGGWHTFKGREDAIKLSSLSINFFQYAVLRKDGLIII